MHEPILEVKKLSVFLRQSKNEQQPVLENINFKLMAGETLAIVGESGSGKTMLALSLMQLLPENARVSLQSEILYQGQDLLEKPLREIIPLRGKKIAMIFQEAMVALNPVFTVFHQIEEVLKKHTSLSKAARALRVNELLKEVGISDTQRVANSYIHQLSGGLRQRAMIAMALAGDPEILIADEPTTAIDVTIAQQILNLLQELQKKRHLTLIFISHDLAVVAKIAKNILVLKQGKLVESSSLQEFIKAPKNSYSKELIEAVTLSDIFEKKGPEVKAPLLEVDDLKVFYPIRSGFFQRIQNYVHAVDGVSFKCYPGHTLAIIGESGSGKTSISNAVLQLIDCWSGEVHFAGQNISAISSGQLRKLRKDLQIIFQDPFAAMDPRMLVGDILLEGLRAQNIGTPLARELLIDEMLVRVGLSPTMKDRYPHEFSGGQRQRICIARALVMQPKLLICDEPTSALDVIVQKQILQLLKKLQQEFDLAYLLITHHLHVVNQLADEVIVLHEGKIVEQGATASVLHAPQHPYTQKLIQAMPKLQTTGS